MGAAEQILKRIVLDQCVRNQECTEGEDSFTVDIERVLAVSFCTVGQYIENSDITDHEKAAGCFNDEQGGKKCKAADGHQNQRQDAKRRPNEMGRANAQNQCNDSGNHRTDTTEIKTRCNDLQSRTDRPNQNGIKFSRANHTGDGFKATADAFAKSERKLDGGKAKQDVSVGIALNTGKTGKQKENTEEFAKSGYATGNSHQ